MPNIIIAVTISVGAYAILYLLAKVLGNQDAKEFASAGFSVLGVVYPLLLARSAKRALEKPGLGPTTGVDEFSIHPLSAILFSVITWFGVYMATGFLMAFLLAFAQMISESKIDIASQPKLIVQLVIYTAVPLRVIAASYIGCWIGTRSPRHALAIVIGAIPLGCTAGLLWSYSMMSSEDLKAAFGEPTLLARFEELLPDMALYMFCAALGFWYGQRQRFTYYLAFLMRVLPQGTRQTIVEMAHDEALKARQTAIQEPALLRSGGA
jgi:hypothetical protein